MDTDRKFKKINKGFVEQDTYKEDKQIGHKKITNHLQMKVSITMGYNFIPLKMAEIIVKY